MLNQILSRQFNFSLTLILIFFVTDVYSQFQSTNYKILGITVEGNVAADATTIIANSGLKVGDDFDVAGDQTTTALRRLWGLRIFDDIQIIIDKQIDNGVFLLIKVKELQRIEKAVVEGNDEIDDDDILEQVSFVRGHILKPQELYRIIGKIKALYEEEGFLNSNISTERFTFFNADTSEDEIITIWRSEDGDEYELPYELKAVPKNLIDQISNRILMKFIVEEGTEVVVRKIEFEGNNSFEDDELRGTFDETSEARWWKFWSSSNLNQAEFVKDKELLVAFYKENGFKDAAVLSDTLIFSEDKKDVTIKVNVYEGPRYFIRNINWEGNTVYNDFILTERLDITKGDIYNMDKFNKNLRGNETQSDVSSLYLDNGYLFINLIPTDNIIGTDSVDIEIRVIENNQFKIGSVEIKGNDRTKEKVIRRELYTIPSDYFNRALIIRSIQQLSNLQYFNVEKLYQGIETKPVNDSTVNIVYTVEEKSSDYLNASVGYSGSFGFSGAIGITLSNFSIAEPFQMGGGQILNFNWQFGVGNYFRTFTVGFTEPWFLDTPTLVGFDAFDTRQRYTYDVRQSGGSVKVGRRLRWPDDYFYLQGTFRFLYNDVIDGGFYYAGIEGLSRQYTLGASIVRRDIDNPIFPSQGSSVSLDAEISGGPILPGDIDYYKINFKAEFYNRLLNSNRLAFYAVADIGYIDELVRGTKITPFEFFYMGGNGLVIATTPLRGYEDRTVGPKNANGDVIGGKVLSRFTAEIRAALALEPIPIYVLAFAEAGNVYFDLKETDYYNLRKSIGVGARILINPIGLIGFDFGYGFDRKEVDGSDPSWLFHFQFGKGF